MTTTIINSKPKFFLNDKIAKKILKNEKLGKQFSARVISDVIGADYEEVYNNITVSTEELAFSSLTVNNEADSIYYDDLCYFNIEINGTNTDSKPRQLGAYVCQLYLGQLHSCEDYNKIKKIVQISIDAYDFYGYGDFMYSISLMDEKYHFIASDKIQMIHLNLDFLRHKEYNEIVKEKNNLMKDLYFLVCGIDKLDFVYERMDKLMKDVINEAKKIAGVEKMNLFLTDEQMLELDQKHYIEVGKEQTMREMINSFYQNGASLDLISKSSGLSIEKINKIINNK